MAQTFDNLLIDTPRSGVMTVTINRPDALNALNVGVVQDLYDLFTRVRHDSTIRAIVLTGAGAAFCAGLDLKGYGYPPGALEGEGRVQLGLRGQQHIAQLVDAVRSVRAPIIAAVNGAAAGGGMSLALMADIRVMSEGAKLHAAYIRRGLSNCDIGMSWLLPRLIGFSRASQIMLTGRSIDSAEAERIGLVSSVHPGDELLDAALETADMIAAHSPFGVWMTKEVMWSNLEAPSMRAAIDLENRTQILASQTKDHREAVKSFLEKRPPEYHNH